MRAFSSWPILTSTGRCKYEPTYMCTFNTVRSNKLHLFTHSDTVCDKLYAVFVVAAEERWYLPDMHARCHRTHKQNNNPQADNNSILHPVVIAPTDTRRCWMSPIPVSTCMLTFIVANDECWAYLKVFTLFVAEHSLRRRKAFVPFMGYNTENIHAWVEDTILPECGVILCIISNCNATFNLQQTDRGTERRSNVILFDAFLLSIDHCPIWFSLFLCTPSDTH